MDASHVACGLEVAVYFGVVCCVSVYSDVVYGCLVVCWSCVNVYSDVILYVGA